MQELNDAFGQLWIYILSSVAGAVGFGQDFVKDDKWMTQVLKFINRMTTALFAGVMSYQLAKALGVPASWIFLAVGIGAWRGIKALQTISDAWDRRANGGNGGGK